MPEKEPEPNGGGGDIERPTLRASASHHVRSKSTKPSEGTPHTSDPGGDERSSTSKSPHKKSKTKSSNSKKKGKKKSAKDLLESHDIPPSSSASASASRPLPQKTSDSSRNVPPPVSVSADLANRRKEFTNSQSLVNIFEFLEKQQITEQVPERDPEPEPASVFGASSPSTASSGAGINPFKNTRSKRPDGRYSDSFGDHGEVRCVEWKCVCLSMFSSFLSVTNSLVLSSC